MGAPTYEQRALWRQNPINRSSGIETPAKAPTRGVGPALGGAVNCYSRLGGLRVMRLDY
ncbi:hypothetical protein LY10_04234 [Planktotalea frisia]|uniref:Uncharacterized protein n=1 Tax=Planktotalea frisia TaxID=696762 RepID=A0A1L9NZX4_9RHOB|nr:hypothetical protein PFRI_09300 [Planktotalea frisia]PZX17996.1 hypothetical protein LY10_04234 [Planktotalea frisia]